MEYDYEIERGYYDQFQELDMYRDVIYVYRTVNHDRSFTSMAKLFEGCAEIAATACDAQITVCYLDELPSLFPQPQYYNPDDYRESEFLK
jgi:hypothetical protein